MSEPPVGTFTITLRATVDDDDVHLNITCRPLISAHAIARVLEGAADEIRNGRLDSVTLNPIEPE